MTPVHPGYACSLCGNLQPTQAACTRCKADIVLDVSRESVRDLLRETDERRRDRYRDRYRIIAVGGGMLAIVAMWFVPGYWKARSHSFALPFFADQIILMVAVALGLVALLERLVPRSLFPWLDGLPPPTAR